MRPRTACCFTRFICGRTRWRSWSCWCAWRWAGGERTGVDWLQYADPIAALMVAAVIIRVGSQLGRRTLDALLDTAPIGLQQRIASTVNTLDGVLAAERVRVRRVGRRHFFDVTSR